MTKWLSDGKNYAMSRASTEVYSPRSMRRDDVHGGKSKERGGRGLMGKRGGRRSGGVWTCRSSKKNRKSAHAIKKRIEKSNGVHASLLSPVVWETGLVSRKNLLPYIVRDFLYPRCLDILI